MKIFRSAALVCALCMFMPAAIFAASNKKIVVNPAEAKLYIDGNYVGDGSYFVKFDKKNDMFVVKAELEGYVTKEFKIFRDDTRKVISVDLKRDDSIEGSVASNLANKYFTVNVRDGVDEVTAWKLLSQTMLNYFDEMKTSDRAAGYMNTSWVEHRFPKADVKVRTMVQIKQVLGDGLAYQIRISSEISPLKVVGDSGYRAWPRVVKQYETLINEMQMRLGN